MKQYATLLVESKDGYDEFRNKLKRLEKQIRDSIVEVQKVQDISHGSNKPDVMVEVQLGAADLQAIKAAISALALNIIATSSYEYK